MGAAASVILFIRAGMPVELQKGDTICVVVSIQIVFFGFNKNACRDPPQIKEGFKASSVIHFYRDMEGGFTGV